MLYKFYKDLISQQPAAFGQAIDFRILKEFGSLPRAEVWREAKHPCGIHYRCAEVQVTFGHDMEL